MIPVKRVRGRPASAIRKDFGEHQERKLAETEGFEPSIRLESV